MIDQSVFAPRRATLSLVSAGVLCLAASAAAAPVFVGPPNPGAESGLTGWLIGHDGSGSVAIGTDDPATGANCFKIAATDTVPGETNRADFRCEPFPLKGAGIPRRPITFSFAYKLPGMVRPGDNVEVYFRFYDKAGTFLDQKIARVGARTADSEMNGYKTMTMDGIIAPTGAATADVWVAENIFTPWSSGIAEFDDFSVTTVPALHWGGVVFNLGVAIVAGAIGVGIGMAIERGKRPSTAVAK